MNSLKKLKIILLLLSLHIFLSLYLVYILKYNYAMMKIVKTVDHQFAENKTKISYLEQTYKARIIKKSKKEIISNIISV